MTLELEMPIDLVREVESPESTSLRRSADLARKKWSSRIDIFTARCSGYFPERTHILK